MTGKRIGILTPEQEAEKNKILVFIEEVAGGLGQSRQVIDDVLTILSDGGRLPQLKGARRSPRHPWVNAEGRVIDESELFND
ncbi:hypothetical protein JW752_04980 [Candidatus Peregrinibacteria bacterium]|nr:hypothetical protein [Candidatus Peregrinibacteria bacterium]